MTVSYGDIIKIDGDRAVVRLNADEGCGACPSRDRCRQTGHTEMEVDIPSGWTVAVGDEVSLAFSDAPVATAALLAYLLPIVCLIAGAALGSRLDSAYGNASPVYAALLAVVCFAIPLACFRLFRKRVRRCGQQNAQLVQILTQTQI